MASLLFPFWLLYLTIASMASGTYIMNRSSRLSFTVDSQDGASHPETIRLQRSPGSCCQRSLIEVPVSLHPRNSLGLQGRKEVTSLRFRCWNNILQRLYLRPIKDLIAGRIGIAVRGRLRAKEL